MTGRNLLFLSPHADWPLYGGAVVRIHHLVHHLARHNRVWWVTRGPRRGPALDELAGHLAAADSRWLQLFDPRLVLRLRRLIRQERIDTVLASTWIPGLHAALLKRLTGARFVLDEHNVEFTLVPWLKPVEGFLYRQADEVWCVSEPDRAKLEHAFGRHALTVVPNGAEPLALDPEAKRKLGLNGPVALFYGVLGYAPNRQAVEAIARELAPRLPDVTFAVAGVGTERLAPRGNFRPLGFVPELATLLGAADVVIAPLRQGSGTRLKILEALAAGRPVVSTPLGAEGLPADPNLHVRHHWDEFAAAILEQLQRPACPAGSYGWRV